MPKSHPDVQDLPPGYRMTELGPLPEEWRVVRLGEIYTIQQGKALSSKHRSGQNPFPFLRTANVLWGYVDLSNLDTMDFTEKERSKLRLQPGDLLICEGGEIGRTAIWEGQLEDVFYQNHIFRVRAKTKKAHPHFHMYWMQAAIKVLGLYRGRGNKTTIPNLSKRRLAEFPIPLPPLSEQRAIAHVLRAVQEAREATERVIAALRDLKRSLMRHLFTYGPVPVDQADQVALQDTPIGPLPAHWRVVRLGEVGKIVTGKTPSTSNTKYWGGSIPFITPSDLDGKEIYRAERTITTEGLAHTKPVPRGAVLVSCIGYIGKIGVVGSRIAATNQQINAIIPNETKIKRWFLAYALDLDQVQQVMDKLTRKTTVPILNKSNFSKVWLPLPPLDEQREIARILQTVDRKIEAEEARKEALEGLFKSLLHHLMTAKIRLPKAFVDQFGENKEVLE